MAYTRKTQTLTATTTVEIFNPGGGDINSIGEFDLIEYSLTNAADAGGATNPSLAAKLQGTLDDTNWFDVADVKTPASNTAETVRGSIERSASQLLGKRLRWSFTVAGTVATPSYVVTWAILARKRGGDVD